MRAFVFVLSILILPRIAWCFPNEPQGFGKARFGMSVASVQKLYPGGTFTARSTARDMVHMEFYKVEKQALGSLKPCSVEFRFAADKLYEIGFDCGRDVKVVTFLQKRYGNPQQIEPHGTYWQGQTVVIALNAQTRMFAFANRLLNQAVQQELLRYALSHPGGAQATPSPAPTP